jgi:flagellar basal body-associated protein FliL
MSQEANGLITLLVLMVMVVLLVVAAMGWLIHTDKAGFDEEQARKDAEELLADAANNVANRRRVRAGQCAGDRS